MPEGRTMIEDIAVLIPAYQPEARLADLVSALKTDFSRILVVDDGSSEGRDVFSRLAGLSVPVERHACNRGKGAALKTGFDAIMRMWPTISGIVTADADGQHLPKDILGVAKKLKEDAANGIERLVVGARRVGKGAPFKSRFANAWTRAVFRFMSGYPLSDTQTGLRGIPATLVPRVAAIGGDRYEFEILMLMDAAAHPSLPVEIPIETVYLDGNKSSHFRPFADSLSTQGALWGAGFRRIFSRRASR